MKAALSGAVVQRRLERRGFRGLSAEEAGQLAPWMRFTPTLQAIVFGISTVTGSVSVLRLAALLLLVGLITGRHPFDWLYEWVIRPLEKSPRLPPAPPLRLAVFALGICWCLVTAHFFDEGRVLGAHILGGAMTASTALLAFTHICVPSAILSWLAARFGRPHA